MKREHDERHRCFLGIWKPPLLMLVFLIAWAATMQAQFLSQLSGTVSDSSGAVVPGAQVTMKNQASGITRDTTTNGQGYFTIVAVPAGTYTVTVTLSGFVPWEQKDLALVQGDERSLNGIVLQVSSGKQAVSVEGTAVELVPESSGEKSSTIGTQELQNLTLEGRSADELLKILPGVAPNNGLGNGAWFSDNTALTNLGPGGAYSANGAQPGSMAMEVDGASIIDQGCNCTHTQVANIDQIQEIKLQTSNYNAEYAKGPVILTAVGKSGGTEFHGAIYFRAGNGVLNSRDALASSKPSYFEYYPGVAVGGPVLIPGTRFNKSRNKLFFFGGFELYQQTPPGSLYQAYVPTTDMLAGNLSPAVLAGLQTGLQGLQSPPTGYPGGMVPQTSMDKDMVYMTKFFPQPNADPATSSGFNWSTFLIEPQNSWQGRIRADYSITDNTKLAVTYSMQDELDHNPIQLWGWSGAAVPYPTDMLGHLTSKIVDVNFVHVFSPTMTNEFVFTDSRFVNSDAFVNDKLIARSQLPYAIPGVFNNGSPQIPQIVNNPDQGLPGLQGVPAGGGAFFGAIKQGSSVTDNLSKVLGTHTMKFGFYYDWIGNLQASSTPSNGQLNFSVTNNALTTGNIMADYLLGILSSYQESESSPVLNIHYNSTAFFAQDSWKVARRLTIEYGVRFDHLTPWKDNTGVGFASWIPSQYTNNPAELADHPGIEWHAIDPSVPNTGRPIRPLFYEPRFGLAYDVFGNGKTVLRGGWGMFRFQTSSDDNRAAVDYTHANIEYNSPAPLLVSQVSSQTYSPTVSKGSLTAMSSTDSEEPLTSSYSFSVDQAVPGHSVAEFGYVGSKTTNGYIGGGLGNINNVPLGALFQPDPITGAPANPGSANLDDYRPMTNYSQVTVLSHGSYQNYNGFQASWRKVTQRYFFSLNYTFSKALGIWTGDQQSSPGSLIDPFNMAANYGPLSYDHTQLFNSSYSVQLPNPVRDNAFLKGVVNGWQLSGVTLIQSGAPVQPNAGGDLYLSASVDSRTWLGTDAETLQPVVICNPSSGLGTNQHMNPACFASPTLEPLGTNGTIVFPYMRGVTYFNSDLSIFKNFQISERKRIQFRAMANNFLNHPLHTFDNWGNEVLLNFIGATSQLANASTFGYAARTTGSRQLAFSARFEF